MCNETYNLREQPSSGELVAGTTFTGYTFGDSGTKFDEHAKNMQTSQVRGSKEMCHLNNSQAQTQVHMASNAAASRCEAVLDRSLSLAVLGIYFVYTITTC